MTDPSVVYDEMENRKRARKRQYIQQLLDILPEYKGTEDERAIYDEIARWILDLGENVNGKWYRAGIYERWSGGYYVVISPRHRWVSD